MKRTPIILLALLLFAASMSAQKTYVLLTGINDYGMDEESNLNYPVKDVNELKQVFNNQHYTIATLTGKYVTLDNIEKKLNAIVKLAKPSDKIIFYFSGHGGTGAIACYQGIPLTYDRIIEWLSKAKTSKVFCFIDACHSGSALGATLSGATQMNKAKPIFMTACRPEEMSSDTPFIENGLFTQSLLKGLRGKADENGDRKITLVELFRYVHQDVVSKMSKFPSETQMHPQLIGSTSLYDTILAEW